MQEQEQNQTVEKVKLPTKVTLTIRVLVGGYLLYTAYSLIDAFKTNTGKEQLFFGVFMLLFVVCGIFLVVHGVRGLINGKYIGGAMDLEAEAGEDTADDGKEE